jgi:phytoene dehydrogenase-like protein
MEVTLPGFRHDLGSSIHPMAVASPFFRSLDLERHGLQWLHSPAVLAHPLDDGTAVMLYRDIEQTVANLDRDAQAYWSLIGSLVDSWDDLQQEILGPLGVPEHPIQFARFGASAALPASWLARMRFRGTRARALFAGLAAHSILPLSYPFSSGVGLVLAAAGHKFGWPFPRGGAQNIAQSLVNCLQELGGTIECGHKVEEISEFLDLDAVLCDLGPKQLMRVAGKHLPAGYRSTMRRYQYGPGIYKVDWALSEPIPWAAKECAEAGTVHLGGTLEEIEASEKTPWQSQVSPRPFVLLAPTSLFDDLRAPSGQHTAWGYCHVPNGSREPMLETIERQIERFAPGFRDCVLARKVWDTHALELWNGNLVGGDISGGALTMQQLFFRPGWTTYNTPVANLFLCSASTPPGAGVHGMCGYHAASRALRGLGLLASTLP